MNLPKIYLEWRFWVGVFVPFLACWTVAFVMPPTLVNYLLLFSFMFMVMPSFTRHMARSQTKAELRAELIRLQAEFRDVVKKVNRLPYREQVPYVESLYKMEFRIRVLEQVLESPPPNSNRGRR